ncbi:hypothetical protein AVEN_92569-1 [Araneus ventricosus]|uniref:Uncharacterized protein n=1 Tax=Araneus ventricosus TaxID=182803 RepID=A0A4Y2AHW8_ARAVE|nr:hypothetical protein AVEN_92569-1 [Araneus ventricosus]
MIYYSKTNKYIKQGFCTISSSLCHDPCGVWDHLKSVFNHVVMLNPNVKQLHIISNSPTSQYRNKLNFYLFTKEIVKYFPALASATWNYTKSGQCKGAPDGTGSIIKQSADKAVTEGNDIPDVDALFKVLRERYTGVFVTTASESDITVIEKSLPQRIKPFVGTMKVHQISWCRAKPSSIDARSLSCFKCKPGNKCIHYHIKSHSYQDEMVDNSAIKINSWVAVQSEDEWCSQVREVVEVIDEDIKVNFMIRAGQQSVNITSSSLLKQTASGFL